MQGNKLSIVLTAVLVICTVTLLVTGTRAAAQTETVLHNFSIGTNDANGPMAGLIFDAAGNLYGTTVFGGHNGNFGDGAVFELVPQAGGGWKGKVLRAFSAIGNSGYNPHAGVVMDAAGNLYGTTFQGGAHGAGTIFELQPQSNGNWIGKVLHQFGGSSGDGANPEAGLILDSAGNLYGTTSTGGTHAVGIAFELSPTAGGSWKEKVLHTFGGTNDGSGPRGSLIFDAAGNLYGTTSSGGSQFSGTVFELKPTTGGHWTEKILYNFSDSSPDGGFPEASLIFDAAGNLYGTTAGGGANGDGIVFELKPTTSGTWTETNLHDFNADGADGVIPVSSVVFDASGNLYGTTAGGGTNGWGIVYELTAAAGGTWTETVLHTFNNDGTDGIGPDAGVIVDGVGNLFGTAPQGGTLGGGIVYEITP